MWVRVYENTDKDGTADLWKLHYIWKEYHVSIFTSSTQSQNQLNMLVALRHRPCDLSHSAEDNIAAVPSSSS